MEKTLEELKIWVKENSERKLSDIFHVYSIYFTRDRIEDLGLSVRSNNCLSRYLDPPLSSPNGVHFTLDEILDLKVKDLRDIKNLGHTGFIDVLKKVYDLISKRSEDLEELSEVKNIIDSYL